MKPLLLLRLPESKDILSYDISTDETDTCFHFVPFNRQRHPSLELYLKPGKIPESLHQPEGEFESYQLYREDYLKLIADTRTTISANGWGKIVMSRSQKISCRDLDLLDIYKQLCEAYPHACVYLFQHPECGMWVGATPELLLSGNKYRLQTMSLAGTRKAGEEESFTPKEEEEQSIVTSYIAEKLEQHAKVNSVRVGERQKIRAGNLFHFLNRIEAEMEDGFSESDFLCDFHPTPAVGGFPKDEALQYILENENHDRAYYSGYFGIKIKDNYHYFVNLRCMQVFSTSVVLFAGGGITAASDPLSEWEETEAKMQTLLNILNIKD